MFAFYIIESIYFSKKKMDDDYSFSFFSSLFFLVIFIEFDLKEKIDEGMKE